ncbi:beta-glucosidase BglX [Flavobacterium sp. Fl-77]|uniref:beta-glucosidase n=1 Tax=Flavobacterium flavipigmentatum TaxID=2893884 RepID=A0AAJ2S8W0_9FLAO|nr:MULTISPECIES: beta-glucosidase BglX [unclassified Flavobacterium]MDX6182800.1 beta-glucosidase BglX [Flavobacterium sp. Fl-33]MDX6186021.1 beta-glucosidase BglX [Flavobacterium sp. Fl-77]UFH38174.1 beta-glucosidase BglX [Flavobacterium sp. F-70]
MIKRKFKNYAFLMLIVFGNGYAQSKTHLDATKPIEDRISLLMKEMTLEEKVGQMNQYNGSWDVTGPKPESGSNEEKYNNIKKGLVGSMLSIRGVKEVRAVQKIAVEETRLGIPLLFGFDVIHGYKTISPIPLAEAASWDLEAIKNSARVAAVEASASGLNWTFAPNVDISNDARWGRVMEGAGEDPYLGSKIATARVKGFQGESLSANTAIIACAKHFAGYGFVEAGREYNSVDMSNSKLYNSVLPPFKAAVDSGIRTFMNSFNTLNGIPATGNIFLQRDILKGAWKFNGFVVSDWASIAEMITHGYAADGADAAQKAVIAGSDMDMESNVYVTELAQLVKKGLVKESLIDDAVRRILRVKFELGLFDNPYKYCDEAREKSSIGNKANNDVVLDMAKKSIVLLKNTSPSGKNETLLPLKKEGVKIALIGALANDKNSPLGSWRIAADDNTAVSVLEGMQQYKNNMLVYEKGTDVALNKQAFVDEVKINTTDFSGFEAAKKAAKESEVVVMVLGEIGFQSGEGRSRTELGLPGNQQQLLEEVYKVNPNIILVLNNGRPLALPWAQENIPAIVEAWQLGTQSGNAIAQVLYGDYNPSGKLTMSFPRNVGQCPIYYNLYNTGRPTNKDQNAFWSHYIDVEKTPLYPFGYGLSYTSFEYKNLKLAKTSFQKGEKIELTVDVTNTGNVDGKEVVQLYINDVAASVVRPVKELKGFELIALKKGETKTVQFTLTDKELGFYDNNGNFLTEAGLFNVLVGWNSNEGLTSKFELK